LNVWLGAALLVAFVFTTAQTPLWVFALLLFGRGFSRSLQLGALNGLAYLEVEPRSLSAATSAAAIAQRMAQAFSVALVGIIMSAFSGLHPGGHAMKVAIVVICLLSLISLFDLARLREDTGSEASGHRPSEPGVT
jgi:hypothetical protein